MKLRFYLFFLTLIVFASGMYADVEHTVERGETVESIARLYGITPDDILQDNPMVKDMFFAGMILKINTDKKNSSKKDTSQSLNPNYEENPSSSTTESIRDDMKKAVENNENIVVSRHYTTEIEEESLFSKGSNFYGVIIGYFFPKEYKSTVGDTKQSSYGFSMMYSLRAGRYFIDNLFGEINLGFSLSSSSTLQYSIGSKMEKSEYTQYAIPVNLHIGYTLPFNKRSGISLYTGPFFNIPVGNKYKIAGEKVEYPFKTKVSCCWDFGAEVNLASFVIGGRYTISMNSEKGNLGTPKGIWMVYIGAKF